MNYVILDEYPNYEIYKNGKIISTERLSKTGKALKRRELHPTKTKNGYRTVRLINKDGMQKQFYLHRLIWEAFNGEIPEGYEIDHYLADRADNNLSHLRILNHKDNCNNPKSIERYKTANALDKGKYDFERMQQARSKEYYDKLVETYKALYQEHGKVGIMELIKKGHCNFYRAKKLIEEMEDESK